MEMFENNEGQIGRFRRAANLLLNKCFLLKKLEETKQDYFFVVKNRKEFEEYFSFIGYGVDVDEMQGVIALVNNGGSGRIHLKKQETIFLLILRLLYAEKRRELSLSNDVIISIEDIQEKYNILRITAKANLDKTMLRENIKLFKRFNLISALDGDSVMPEAKILIYPSILFAARNEDINKYYDEVIQKVKTLTDGIEVTADEEEDFEDEENV